MNISNHSRKFKHILSSRIVRVSSFCPFVSLSRRALFALNVNSRSDVVLLRADAAAAAVAAATAVFVVAITTFFLPLHLNGLEWKTLYYLLIFETATLQRSQKKANAHHFRVFDECKTLNPLYTEFDVLISANNNYRASERHLFFSGIFFLA